MGVVTKSPHSSWIVAYTYMPVSGFGMIVLWLKSGRRHWYICTLMPPHYLCTCLTYYYLKSSSSTPHHGIKREKQPCSQAFLFRLPLKNKREEEPRSQAFPLTLPMKGGFPLMNSLMHSQAFLIIIMVGSTTTQSMGKITPASMVLLYSWVKQWSCHLPTLLELNKLTSNYYSSIGSHSCSCAAA